MLDIQETSGDAAPPDARRGMPPGRATSTRSGCSMLIESAFRRAWLPNSLSQGAPRPGITGCHLSTMWPRQKTRGARREKGREPARARTWLRSAAQ